MPLVERHVDDAARKRPLRYDKGADQHYDFVSAFIKSMRGSDPDAAVYYLAAMLEGERTALHRPPDDRSSPPRTWAMPIRALCWSRSRRRTPSSTSVSRGAAQPGAGGDLPRGAPKSKASANAIWSAREEVRKGGNLRPPAMLLDTSYKAASKLGRGVGYVDPHVDPRGSELDYLPEERRYYRPSGNGEEAADDDPDR